MNIIKLVKEEVKKVDPQAEVILFGSRARGDSKPDSDWDFLILLQIPFNKKIKSDLLDRLYELELKTDTVISSIIHSKSDWKKRYLTPFYQIIEKEGVTT